MVKLLAKQEDGRIYTLRPLTFNPYNDKIADINESDTDPHTFDLGGFLKEIRKIVEVTLVAIRMVGIGSLRVYSNEGAQETYMIDGANCATIGILYNRIKYAQEVANDDFDLYLLKYLTEG